MTIETIPTIDFNRTYTNAEFEDLPSFDGKLELIEGKLVIKMAGDRHGRIINRLNRKIAFFDPEENLGIAWSDTSFDMGIGWIPAPDLGFIVAARVPPESEKSVQVIPDLAVEVWSPSDLDSQSLREAAMTKIRKYQEVGVRLIWAINPRQKMVLVYRPGQAEPIKILHINDQLDGEEIIPGFVMPVKALFE